MASSKVIRPQPAMINKEDNKYTTPSNIKEIKPINNPNQQHNHNPQPTEYFKEPGIQKDPNEELQQQVKLQKAKKRKRTLEIITGIFLQFSAVVLALGLVGTISYKYIKQEMKIKNMQKEQKQQFVRSVPMKFQPTEEQLGTNITNYSEDIPYKVIQTRDILTQYMVTLLDQSYINGEWIFYDNNKIEEDPYRLVIQENHFRTNIPLETFDTSNEDRKYTLNNPISVKEAIEYQGQFGYKSQQEYEEPTNIRMEENELVFKGVLDNNKEFPIKINVEKLPDTITKIPTKENSEIETIITKENKIRTMQIGNIKFINIKDIPNNNNIINNSKIKRWTQLP